MKAEDIAYCAGLFDGEGCVHIARIHTKKKNLTFQLNCKVSINHLFALELFRFFFGGSIRKEKQDESHNKSGLLHSWSIFGDGAVNFLTHIMPYLLIKKPQAELALQFQATKHWGAEKGNWGNQSKNKERLEIEEKQYLLMRRLKKEVSNV